MTSSDQAPRSQPTLAMSALGESDDPLVGTMLLGKWRVLGRLGAGSFGTVYKVEDVKGGWIEALKILGVDRLTGADAENTRLRFLREAQIMKRLGHKSPHIVDLSTYDEDLEAGLVYFAMEYVNGKSLAALVHESGPLPVERVVGIALQVCSALMAAHEGPEPVVHRDLKLENLMLAEDPSGDLVKVLDFGIAKIAEREQDSRLTTAGTLGTPGYAAPEQLRAGAVDGRTDLFAFGVILYALLTGRDPWMGFPAAEPTSQTYELMLATDRGEVRAMRGTGVVVPPAMEALVLKLLRRNPDERFQSARELKDAIETLARGGKATWMEGRPGAAAAPSGAARRSRMVPALTAAVVVLAAGMVVWRPWGRTLDAAELPALAAQGRIAGARLTAVGVEGKIARGALPATPFRAAVSEEALAGTIGALLAAGVPVDASLEVDRLVGRAAAAQAEARYYGYDGDDVQGYARRAAALDPVSADARSLLRKVAERMAWDAEAAAEDGDAPRAAELTRACLEVVPDHERCRTSNVSGR